MPKLAEIAFRTWTLDGPFQYFDANRRIVDGNLIIDAISAYPAISSRAKHDLTDSHFGTTFATLPNISNGSTEAQVSLALDANNAITIAWGNGAISTIRKVAGVNNQTWATYDPVNHKYIRIRETAGRVYWEASPTGTTWTSLRPNEARPFELTALDINLLAGNWNSAANPGFATFGPVNTYDASTQPVVENTVIDFGIANEPWPASATTRQQYLIDAGATPKYDLAYANMGGSYDAFTLANLNTSSSQGMVPYVTLEAWDTTQGSTYSYANILAGNHNAKIDSWAAIAKSFGKTLYLRPFHEMNGNWYPWCVGVNGNTAQGHKDAWNYLRTRFANAGVTNVKWVWSPNTVFPGAPALADLYPGNANVDVVAVDGYNFGTSTLDTNTWRTAGQVFNETFTILRGMGVSKPLWIGETAASENGGNKAAWITDFFAWMRQQPDLRTFVWFNIGKAGASERDWRIASSSTAASSFRTGMTTITASNTDVVQSQTANVMIFLDGSWRPTGQYRKVF